MKIGPSHTYYHVIHCVILHFAIAVIVKPKFRYEFQYISSTYLNSSTLREPCTNVAYIKSYWTAGQVHCQRGNQVLHTKYR